MKRLIRVLLLFILICPFCVKAEQNNKIEVYFNIPANVIFENEDIIIREEINCGEKLLEPSHVELDGYIFKGWYNGDVRWDFDNDVVEENITLIAKYLKDDSFNLNVIVDENSIIATSILSDVIVDDELKDVSENDDVDLIFKVTDATGIITDTEMEIFDKVVENNSLIIGKYLDLSLFMEINDDPSTRTEIYETKNKVKVEITIPEDMRFNNRKYSILRLHDNKVEIIYNGFPTKDWKLSFETDKFSLYAIAYSEEKYSVINSPKTGDNIMKWIIMFVTSLVVLEIILIIKRKKSKKEEVE